MNKRKDRGEVKGVDSGWFFFDYFKWFAIECEIKDKVHIEVDNLVIRHLMGIVNVATSVQVKSIIVGEVRREIKGRNL